MGWLVVIGAGLYALHRLAIWMENRGWIYYRRSGDPGSLGNAFLQVQSMLEPDKRAMVEARQTEAVEENDSGDPPEPGPASPR